MNNTSIYPVLELIKQYVLARQLPLVAEMAHIKRDPFWILIATIISLRTKDEVTGPATDRLLCIASTPGEMLNLSEGDIIKAIYPAGFYRNKAKTILYICRELVGRYDSRVPDTIDELLTLKGVGRKTANLVVTLAYGGKGICVDTHVQRVSNRLGYVKTKTPDETEFALRDKLPKKYWTTYNTYLVAYGRDICRPLSPFCSHCCVSSYCERVGVTKSR